MKETILRLQYIRFSIQHFIYRRSAPRYFLVCGLAQVKCLSQGFPLKHDGRRKTTKRKNEQKGFKGSSTGPPGEEIPRVPLRDLRGEKIKMKILKKLRRAHIIEKNT